jgi:hypothetical protein
VEEALQDIAENVRFSENFSICHPAFKPFELPAEAVLRFQQMPVALREKYLGLQLRSFLYGLYYNGSLQKMLQMGVESSDRSVQRDLENNTLLGVNLEFCGRLHENNNGIGYFDAGWQVLRQEEDGTFAVFKAGLTLHINSQLHLSPAVVSVQSGDSVAIRLPRNLMQNGFYMAVGNAGPQKSQLDCQVLRFYFNLSPEGAIAVMADLTEHLNGAEIPFSFKALYNPVDYDRFDSAVLYCDRDRYQEVHHLLRSIYIRNRQHFRDSVPLFTKVLAPGLGFAEEPNQHFSEQESFGLNRCQMITRGLLLARQREDESLEGRMSAIHEQFALMSISIECPYLNPGSEDIYATLDLPEVDLC